MPDQPPTPVNHPAMPRVAFQGALGAFSELAIQQHWRGEAVVVPAESFDEALGCVTAGVADFAVIPVETTLRTKTVPAE